MPLIAHRTLSKYISALIEHVYSGAVSIMHVCAHLHLFLRVHKALSKVHLSPWDGLKLFPMENVPLQIIAAALAAVSPFVGLLPT